MSLGEFAHQDRPPPVTVKETPTPKGWEPSFEFDGSRGQIVTGPVEAQPDAEVWAHIIADWGLDPANMEIIDGSIKLKGWDSPVKGTTTGEKIRLLSYSAAFRQKVAPQDRADVAALCKAASRRKPPKRTPATTEACERALVVGMADWQMGKTDIGGGSEGTVERITHATDRLLERLAIMKKLGAPADVVYLVGLGDLVEGCDGFYAMQTSSVDLSRREQTMVVRRLILSMVDRLVDAGYRIVLTGVAGNHGEHRKNGKAFTDWEDNDDLAVIEQVGDIMAANPDRYKGVSTFLPQELSMCLDVCGVKVGVAHGHQSRGKIGEWWKGQIVGHGPTAPAHILMTGHYHHLRAGKPHGDTLIDNSSGRWWFQCPAMDPGSRWWTETSGSSSPAGMLTLGVGSVYGPTGWGDLAIL